MTGVLSRPLLIGIPLAALFATGLAYGAGGEPPAAGVTVEERLGATVSGALAFKDEAGRDVTLGSYLDGERPVVLTLVYFNCPLLCNTMLNGLVEGMRTLPWAPGDSFQVVTVSIDPREGSELATKKKANYLAQLDGRGADGWHFLTGDGVASKALAESVGWGYRYDADTMQYIHGAAIIVLDPSGKVVRYLHGPAYSEKQLRLALTEAGGGRTGGLGDALMLFFHHFDVPSRRYQLSLGMLVGISGVLALGLFGLTVLMIRSRRGESRVRDGATMTSLTVTGGS